jgi:hypothetical protein
MARKDFFISVDMAVEGYVAGLARQAAGRK